jgi:hypothetical protein
VASSDEIVRVLSAIEDKALASGEILASTGESPAAPGTQEVQQSSALSEEDLFGSLRFDEDEQAAAAPPVDMEEQQPSSPDELTQIVRRPGPPPDAAIPSSVERETTPASSARLSGKTFSKESPFEAQLEALLEEKEAEALAGVVIGLANLLVSKSVLSREEVLNIFASPPDEK